MIKKTKILYVGNKLNHHGFSKTGIETLGPQLENDGFDIIYAGTYKNAFFRLLEMMFSIIRNCRKSKYVLIDTYSSNAFWFAWMAGILCRILNLKNIHILRGGNLPARLNKSAWFCKLIFQKAYANVAVSAYLKAAFDKVGYPAIVIPNNIDIEQYIYLERQSLKPRLMWVRSFHQIYNPNMAADLLSLLIEKYPNAKLCMVGPEKDNSLEKFKEHCNYLGIENRVTITGLLTKPEWHKLSENYDIFINTTNIDNTPVSVIEAMALGLPVVSTNVGGIPYLLDDGKDALLIEKGNVQEMTQAILSLLGNKDLAFNLSKNARAKAESFSWNVVSKKWKELLK